MKPLIIVETILKGIPDEERYKIVADHGYKTVELWDVAEEDADRIKAIADKNGIEIIGISGDLTAEGNEPRMCDYRQQDAYCEMVIKIMKIAKKVGATYLHCHSGRNSEAPGLTNEEKFSSMVLALKRLAPIAEKEGLILLIENCETEWDSPDNYMDCADIGIRIVRMVNSPAVRFIYDMYHEQVMRGNLLRTLKDNLDIIPYIHLSNVPHKCDLEDGEINYSVIAKELKKLDFDGPIGFEIISNGNYEKTFEQIGRFLEKTK